MKSNRSLYCTFRHCVTGAGLSRAAQDMATSGEIDDNSLSPEACYDCKINGYPKRGRKRRSANDTASSDNEVILLFSCLLCSHMNEKNM